MLDASAAIELLMGGPRGRRLNARLRLEPVVQAPHLIDVEIAHTLRRYVLRGEFSGQWCSSALDRWQDLRVDRYGHLPFLNRIWQLRHNVSAYVAVYVALAEALSTVVLTADRRLADVPGLEGRIELI